MGLDIPNRPISIGAPTYPVGYAIPQRNRNIYFHYLISTLFLTVRQAATTLVLHARPLLRSHDAPKTQVVGTRIDLSLSARPDHVSRTILIRAEKRTASMYLLGAPWFRWIIGRVWALGITGNSGGL